MGPFSTNFCKMPFFTNMEFLCGIILNWEVKCGQNDLSIMKKKYIEILQKKI